jgi:hypothetical protein
LNFPVPDVGSVAFDREEVRGHVVLEVQRHERQARPERLVDPDRRLDLAAAETTRTARRRQAVGRASSGEMSSDSPRRSGDV